MEQKRSVAILFTDLVGSTELFQERGDAAATMLIRRHQQILEKELNKHGGKLLKTIGDSLMVIFPKAKKSLQCAMAMQTKLDEYNEQAPPADQMHVRIGVHWGKAIVGADDAYGDVVNTASRIEQLAAGNQIYTSLETWQQAMGLDTEAVPLGKRALKGLAEKMDLVEVLWTPDEIQAERARWTDKELIPTLAEAISARKCMLVLGGLSRGPRKGTVHSEIAHKLSAEMEISERRGDLTRMASAFEDENDREELLEFVVKHLQQASEKPPATLAALAELSIDLVVTTDYDANMEKALLEAGRKVNKVARLDELGSLESEENEVTLVKLLGDVDYPETLALTEEDIRERLYSLKYASEELLAALVTRHLLFIGFRWNDQEFKRLFVQLTAHSDAEQCRAVGVSAKVSAGVRGVLRRKGLMLALEDEKNFAEKLARSLEKFDQARKAQEEYSDSHLIESDGQSGWKRPYKFLSSFQEDDEEIFFGRKDETRKVFSLVVSHRLLVLHGPSGNGKTSLINAGVIPRLKREGYAVLVRRALKEPGLEIREGLIEMLRAAEVKKTEGDKTSGEWMVGVMSAPLSHFLAELSRALDKPLVIFLDQFEEFFLRFPKKARSFFAGELGQIVKDRSLKVKFVLSLRNDFLSHLSEFKSKIPEIMHQEFFLEGLAPDAMIDAIREPAALAGLSFEEGLIERILSDLGTVGSDPPQLQIVCDRLFDELGRGEKVFSMAHYDGVGGAKGILGSYLEHFIDSQTPAVRELGRQVLKALVTSSGTKSVVSAELVVQETGRNQKAVERMLVSLVQARLVRKLSDDQGACFELSHEYLIEEIARWIEEKDKVLKRARELVRQELINFQRFGLLMAPNRVAIVRAQAKDLNLSAEEEDLLKKSLLTHRKKTRLVAALVLFLISAVVVGGFAISRQAKAGLCKEDRNRLAGVWDSGTKQTMEKSFLATGKPFAPDTFKRVDRLLDQYSQNWTAMRRDSCEATRVRGNQSERMLDLRMYCLDQRLSELSALTTLLAGSLDEDILENAIQATIGLTQIDNCADVAALTTGIEPPQAEEVVKQVEAVRKKLAEAKARRVTGKYEEALEIASAALQDASGIEYRPLQAESLFELATVQDILGQYLPAEENLKRAWWMAEEIGYDKLKANTALKLAVLIGDKAETKEGLVWARNAQAILARMPSNDSLEADLFSTYGSIYYSGGDPKQAERYYRQALAQHEKIYGSDNWQVAITLNNVANILGFQFKVDQAAALYRRALAIYQKTLGLEHPLVATVLNNLAIIEAKSKHFDQALVYIRQARDLHIKSRGSENTRVAFCHRILGWIHVNQGELEKGLAEYRKALAMVSKLLGPEHPKVGDYMNLVGSVLRKLKQWPEARSKLRESLRIVEKSVGVGHRKVGLVLINLAHFHIGLGKYPLAKKDIDRALALCDQLPAGSCKSGDVAEMHFCLAQVYWGSGCGMPRKDGQPAPACRAQALQEAEKAHELAKTIKYQPQELIGIGPWIEERRETTTP